MIEIKDQVDLAPLNSWRVGGKADHLCFPKTIEELKEALLWAKNKKLPHTILSGGSNVLVPDEGLRGLTICLRKFTAIETEIRDGRLYITALAGASKSELLRAFLKNQLAPALFLAGLPGDVGGGVVMNAGISEKIVPREFVEIVDWVECLRDEKILTFKNQDLKWSYRHCEGWRPGVITRVGMSWPMEAQPDILQKVRDANALRLKKQPLDKPSCGSVFVNPEPHKAGQLIEACGLKGYRIGGAEISTKHANFIVNIENAKASDIRAVIQHAQDVVKKEKGVVLKTEVVFL